MLRISQPGSDHIVDVGEVSIPKRVGDGDGNRDAASILTASRHGTELDPAIHVMESSSARETWQRTDHAAGRVRALTSAARTRRALVHMRTECSMQAIPLISMLRDQIQPRLDDG